MPRRKIFATWCGYAFAAGERRKPFLITTSAATICPATVATAAPAIPISGRPKRPKIKSGSRTMLSTSPRIWAINGVFISPIDCSTFVQMLSRNSPKLNTHTIRPYTVTSRITASDEVDILA